MENTDRPTMDEVRMCVEAAECLVRRASGLDPIHDAGRLAGLWDAHDLWVDRATTLLQELEGEASPAPETHLDREARIARIAASRP